MTFIKQNYVGLLWIFGIVALLILSCSGPTPVEQAPAPTATPLLVVIETPTITPTALFVPEIDHTATFTQTPTRTPMPTQTSTPMPTATPDPTPTEKPMPKELPRAGGG